MCNFLSAIVMQNGDLITNPFLTDSHEDLLQANNIRDGLAQQGTFARIEFLPPKDHSALQDLSTWTLEVDEQVEPIWFDHAAVRAKLEDRVRRMIIDDERDFLLGGVWILAGGAKIKKVKNSRIVFMLGGSQVGRMWGNSQVGEMWYSSQVGWMVGNSLVKKLHDRARLPEGKKPLEDCR